MVFNSLICHESFFSVDIAEKVYRAFSSNMFRAQEINLDRNWVMTKKLLKKGWALWIVVNGSCQLSVGRQREWILIWTGLRNRRCIELQEKWIEFLQKFDSFPYPVICESVSVVCFHWNKEKKHVQILKYRQVYSSHLWSLKAELSCFWIIFQLKAKS